MEAIDRECYVSFDVARLLKRAGFDWLCKKYYNMGVLFDMESEEVRAQTPQHSSYDVLAPTLEVAQRWLREVENCYAGVEVFVHNLDKDNIYYTYNWFVYFKGDRYSGSDIDTTRYYEVAQKAGIKKALEMILEKGK